MGERQGMYASVNGKLIRSEHRRRKTEQQDGEVARAEK
jgi:hypothetical protein